MILYTGTYLSNKKLMPRQSLQLCTAVVASELAYVDIICVKVEGVSYDIIKTGVPTNRQVLCATTLRYSGDPSNPIGMQGVLYFDPQMGTRSVFVMYQK